MMIGKESMVKSNLRKKAENILFKGEKNSMVTCWMMIDLCII